MRLLIPAVTSLGPPGVETSGREEEKGSGECAAEAVD